MSKWKSRKIKTPRHSRSHSRQEPGFEKGHFYEIQVRDKNGKVITMETNPSHPDLVVTDKDYLLDWASKGLDEGFKTGGAPMFIAPADESDDGTLAITFMPDNTYITADNEFGYGTQTVHLMPEGSNTREKIEKVLSQHPPARYAQVWHADKPGLRSRSDLYSTLKELKAEGFNPRFPKKEEDFSDETYGDASMIYFGWATPADRVRGEQELEKRGFRVDESYSPKSTSSEVQVQYFKGWHWDE